MNTKEILENTESVLNTAKYGLELISGNPQNRLIGIRNLVVFGRAVTFVLQKLRDGESNFEEWYIKYVEEMKKRSTLHLF